MSKKSNTKLFEVVCTARYNRNLSDRIEYLRCESKKMLEDGIRKCFTLEGTEYFGYDDLKVY